MATSTDKSAAMIGADDDKMTTNGADAILRVLEDLKVLKSFSDIPVGRFLLFMMLCFGAILSAILFGMNRRLFMQQKAMPVRLEKSVLFWLHLARGQQTRLPD